LLCFALPLACLIVFRWFCHCLKHRKLNSCPMAAWVSVVYLSEETGAMGRDIKPRQGTGWYFKKRNLGICPDGSVVLCCLPMYICHRGDWSYGSWDRIPTGYRVVTLRERNLCRYVCTLQ
jgi:hypothetical protein